MIDRGHRLPLTRQAAALRISRGSLYYESRPVSAADLAIIRRVDELHLDYPFAGSRMLRDLLRGEHIAVGRDRVTTMMRRMGIEAVDRPNQVWCMDITYIPMARGFVYRRRGLVQRAGAVVADLQKVGNTLIGMHISPTSTRQ
jgi:putative transposase